MAVNVVDKDASGNTLNFYEYDVWGNITSQTEAMFNPFKYARTMYPAAWEDWLDSISKVVNNSKNYL